MSPGLALRGMSPGLTRRGVSQVLAPLGMGPGLALRGVLETTPRIREELHFDSGGVPHSRWITQSNNRPLTTNTARSKPACASRP